MLIFTRTKHGANKLTQHLLREDISAMAIHGNKSQSMRTRALAEFKSGKLQALVATDIAARGIDISELPYVVNFELPNVPADYVHRIGRTGRAGLTGEAISLVCIDEQTYLADIEKLIGTTIPREVVEGYLPEQTIPTTPVGKGSGGGNSRQRKSGQAKTGSSGQGSGNRRSTRRSNGNTNEQSTPTRRRRPRQRVKKAA